MLDLAGKIPMLAFGRSGNVGGRALTHQTGKSQPRLFRSYRERGFAGAPSNTDHLFGGPIAGLARLDCASVAAHSSTIERLCETMVLLRYILTPRRAKAVVSLALSTM